MTNSQTLGTIEATNPVLAVAPLKEMCIRDSCEADSPVD